MCWKFSVFSWFLLYICVYLQCVGGQEQQFLNKLACIEHEECGACLTAAAHCRWCADPYFKSPAPRCNDDARLVADGCSQGSIQRPADPVWEVPENRSLQDMQDITAGQERVQQIQPQRVRLSIKPRDTKSIKFTYRPAKNYPLDLYYLMDLTWSMKDDKETLVSLRDDLPVMLKNLTHNFRLGFGSFAEKPLMPYISMVTKRHSNPCAPEGGTCESTYSYHHHLSLTNEITAFIEKVNGSSVTGNLDNAEAQLDALVQVLVCGDRIGWSPRSRKIVILLSDGLMHTAGDGLLGGATLRNDERCHLNDNGYYSEASTYDYPSVAQIHKLLEIYKVNVIFAVTEDVKFHYDGLHKVLQENSDQNFTYVAKLEQDSSNILKLVKTGYDDIVSVVNFEDDSSEGPVKVQYFTDCGVKGTPFIETRRCTGVEFGMTLNYEARLTLEKCPEYKKSNQKITISESQLGQDALVLEVDIQCGCDCQTQAREDEAITCGPNKHMICGVCHCDKGWSGPNCDCSIENEAVSAALEAQCREPNVTRTRLCSGFGDCLCGDCQCDIGFTGRYCQCKTCAVSLDNGMECGGVERGVCVCGQCACAAGWSGDACDCTDSKDTCVAPGASDACSGRGDCVCGRCECKSTDEDDVRYSGTFCETCATSNCDNPLCATAEPCVSCHLNSSCTDLCTIGNVNYTVSERMNDPALDSSAGSSCVFRREEESLECQYKYSYRTMDTAAMVAMEIVIHTKECYQPTSARIMTSAFVIMACVIASGIIVILAIKSAQIVSDRRAYAKFLEEAQESRKNMQELNPLYISPISEFRLPDSFPRDKND